MNEQPFEPQEDDYLVYTYNRFQACRFGLDGSYVHPASSEAFSLRSHIAQTLEQVMPHAGAEGKEALQQLAQVLNSDDGNDASWLRARYGAVRQLPEVVRQAALRFRA